jgi:hypothetical protein
VLLNHLFDMLLQQLVLWERRLSLPKAVAVDGLA